MLKDPRIPRILVLLCLLGVLAGVALAADKPQTLTGVISDSMCGAKHMMPGSSDADCVRECIKGGAKYVLVVDKKIYTLSGHERDLDRLAGQKVSLSGAVKGDKVQVATVAAAK